MDSEAFRGGYGRTVGLSETLEEVVTAEGDAVGLVQPDCGCFWLTLRKIICQGLSTFAGLAVVKTC